MPPNQEGFIYLFSLLYCFSSKIRAKTSSYYVVKMKKTTSESYKGHFAGTEDELLLICYAHSANFGLGKSVVSGAVELEVVNIAGMMKIIKDCWLVIVDGDTGKVHW
mgnify:CR=1 FL=1